MKRIIPLVFLCLILVLTTCNQDSLDVDKVVLKWRYPINTDNNSLPAIGPSGTIYICNVEYLVALNTDGSLKWEHSPYGGSFAYGSPTVNADETIFYGCVNDNIYEVCAVNADGTLKWKYKPDTLCGYSVSPFAINQDGVIFFTKGHYSTQIRTLYAISSSGNLKWKKEIKNAETPVIGNDGTIYLSGGGCLIALDKEGTVLWAHEPGGSPIIGSDGILYYSYGKKLYALNSDGTIIWSTDSYTSGLSSPTLGSDGSLYVTSTNWDSEYNPLGGFLYAISSLGFHKWSSELGEVAGGMPTIGADGTIYVTGYDPISGLYAFDSEGNVKWTFDGPSSTAAIADDGMLFITGSSELYAIQSSSFGLADSPWPKYAHDNQNTSCAGY